MTSVVARYAAASTAIAVTKNRVATNRRWRQRTRATTATIARTVPVSERYEPTEDTSLPSGVRCSTSQSMTSLSQFRTDPVSTTSMRSTPAAIVATTSAT